MTQLLVAPPSSKSLALDTQMITREYFLALAGGIAPMPNPTRGTLFVVVRDCNHRPGAGVRVRIEPSDEETRQFYLATRLPSRTATETDDTIAAGGFANVEANTSITIHATVADSGLSYASIAAFVRPGLDTITTVIMDADTPR